MTVVTYIAIHIVLVGVSVSSRREPVNNFYCFKNNLVFWLDSCKWEYTTDDILDKEVTFIWGDGSGSWKHAQIHPPNRTYINNLHIMTLNLIVGINVTSHQGGSMTFTSYLSDVWVVQLPSLDSFIGTALNSSCVQLSWKKGGNGRFEKELYVNCTSVWGEQKDGEFRIYGETNIILCGLKPGRVYSCSAKTRIVTLDKKYPSNNPKFFWWSGYSTADVKTKHDVPGASPNITAGGYSWENKEDCRTTNNRGYVWVYWRPLYILYYNGEFNGSQISYNTSDGETILHVNKSVNSIRLEVPCNQSLVIYIRAVNDVGESKTPSIMLISPPVENVLDLIVEAESSSRHQNTSIRYFEWINSNQNDDETTTVFYAEKLSSGPTENPKLCDPGFVGQINWKIVDSTVNKTEITVGDKPYCYAVTTGNHNRSFGINWTACLYVKNKAPKSPENVRITNSSLEKSGTVLLQWNKIECSTEQPYVKWYEIGTCSETTHCTVYARLPSNTSSVALNQSRFPEHMAAVRAITRLGVSGNWSQPLQVSPVVTESVGRGISDGQIAGIVIGVSGLILMTVFLPIGVRKYRRRLYNLKVEPPEVFPDTGPIQIRELGYNVDTHVTDISSSLEDSFIGFDTSLGNGANTDSDRRELNSQTLEISEQTYFKSLNNRNYNTRLNINPESDYVTTTYSFHAGKHQEQLNSCQFLQTDIREVGKSNRRHSDELTPRDVQKSNDSKPCWDLGKPKQNDSHEVKQCDLRKLKHNDLRELDKTTKKDPTVSGAINPFDYIKTIVLEQNIDRETDESSKTDTNLFDKVKHNPLNPCAIEHRKSGLEGNYVTSVSIVMGNRKRRNVRPNEHPNTGYITMNQVIQTSNKPPELMDKRQQTSEHSDHSESDKSGSVEDYVTSIPVESSENTIMKDAKILKSEESENIEKETETDSFSCFEGDITVSHNNKDRTESCLVKMGDSLCDYVNSATICRLTGIRSSDGNLSFKEHYNDSGESYKETIMGGYIDQVTAANIFSQKCISSAEDVEAKNGSSCSAHVLLGENVSNNGEMKLSKESSINNQIVRQLTASNDGYVSNEMISLSLIEETSQHT